jgi:ribonuclease HI
MWHKANVNGASLLDGSHGGGVVVLRDAHGGFVAGAGRFFPSVSDAERVELLACRSAVLVAKDMGIPRLVLETDCMGAKTKITGKELDRSMHGPLVEEIKALLQGFEDYKVQHVSRKCNKVAHLLAKHSCENKTCNTWALSPPDFIVNSLVLDSAKV